MTKNVNARLRRRKERLFAENKFCSFCGVEMVLPLEHVEHQTSKPNMAVLYHTVARYDTAGAPTTVLCCYKCAGEKSDAKQKAVGIEVLRARSGAVTCPTCGHPVRGAVGSPPIERPNLEESLSSNPD